MGWSAFFKDLMTPDDFKNSAYETLVNQISHMAAAAVFAAIYCVAFSAVFGEMPYRLHVVTIAALAYGGVELIQGWKPYDSWVDWFNVMCGVLMVVVTFREVSTPEVWHKPHLEVNLLNFIAVFTVWVIALFILVRRRVLGLA